MSREKIPVAGRRRIGVRHLWPRIVGAANLHSHLVPPFDPGLVARRTSYSRWPRLDQTPARKRAV